MYICPTCQRKFESEDAVTKHFLQCWREQHPFHKSSSAPHSEDITKREVNDDVLNFFASLQGKE